MGKSAASSRESATPVQNGVHSQAHSHIPVKAAPLDLIGQMAGTGIAAPKSFPKMLALLGPPEKGRVTAQPPLNRRLTASYAHAMEVRRQQIQISCGEDPGLCMIHDKLVEIENGLQDFEDILAARNSKQFWEAEETKKMQQTCQDLHHLMKEEWKQRHQEAGLFVAAIHQLTTKVELVQAKSDRTHEAIMQELREVRNQYSRVHGVIADANVLLGQTSATMHSASETIVHICQTKGFGKGQEKGKHTEENSVTKGRRDHSSNRASEREKEPCLTSSGDSGKETCPMTTN